MVAESEEATNDESPALVRAARADMERGYELAQAAALAEDEEPIGTHPLDDDDLTVVEDIILAIARQSGKRRFSITVDVHNGNVLWDVHAWAPGYEMVGAASLAAAIAEEKEAGDE
jgi:hypothetical protein